MNDAGVDTTAFPTAHLVLRRREIEVFRLMDKCFFCQILSPHLCRSKTFEQLGLTFRFSISSVTWACVCISALLLGVLSVIRKAATPGGGC
jgi:hypothetical protein